MWRPKSSSEALLPIYIASVVSGCGLIRYPAHHIKIEWSIFFTIFHVSGFSICAYFIHSFLLSAPWIGNEEKTAFSILYTHIFMMFCNIITVYVFRNVHSKILERAKSVDESLQILGCQIDYQSIFRESLFSLGLWLISSMIMSAICILWIENKGHLKVNFTDAIVLLHPIHMNNLSELVFNSSVRFIGRRLKLLNQSLSDIKKSGEVNRQVRNQIGNKGIRIDVTSQLKFRNQSVISTLQVVKQIHLELNMLGRHLMKVFGIHETMSMIVTYILMTGSMYYIYLEWQSLEIDSTSKIIRISILSLWIVTSILKCFASNNICHLAGAEYKRTSEIIHGLDISFKDDEFRREIRQFSIQIMQNKMDFRPCGLFTFGCGFLRSFFSSVTTNLVILIQMADGPKISSSLQK